MMSSDESESGCESVDSNYEDASFDLPPNLVSLPYEILLKIFGYLEPFFLSKSVSIVCKRFAFILNDEIFWKSMLNRMISKYCKPPYVAAHPVNIVLNERCWWCSRDLLWRNLAVQFSIQEYRWCSNQSKMSSHTTENLHYAPIDTIKFLRNGSVIVSGGRDRAINVSRIDHENLTVVKVDSALRGHDGWIWDFDTCSSDQFYSCGWDNLVTYWSLSNGLERISQFNCGKPVMSVSATQGLLAAGLHIPRVVLIDPRFSFIHEVEPNLKPFDYHRHTVTDVLLVPERNLLLSISEDKTLSYFDLRQLKPFKTFCITDENSFPRRMSLYRNMLYIGDSRGKVFFHSIDDETSHIPPVYLGQNRLVTCVQPHLSSVVAGSTAGYVKIFYPSSPPVFLWEKSFNGEVTSIDQYDDLLAVSSASNSLSLFRPKKF